MRSCGKIVLGGEYAILWDGCAIVIPAGEAVYTPDESDAKVLCCPPFEGAEAQEAIAGLTADWAQIRSFAQEHGVGQGQDAEDIAKTLSGTFDTSDLYCETSEGRKKWGFGSSGAVRGLLWKLAMGSQATATWTDLRQMFEIDGSGVDLAMALHCAPLRFTRQTAVVVQPRGVEAVLVKLQELVRTPGRVARMREIFGPEGHKDDVRRRRELEDLAILLANSYAMSTHNHWIESLQAYDIFLESLTEMAGFSRTTQEIQSLQAQCPNGYVRPCGAGGDVAIVLPTTPGDMPVIPQGVQQRKVRV